LALLLVVVPLALPTLNEEDLAPWRARLAGWFGAGDEAGGVRFVMTEAVGEVAFVTRDVVEADLAGAGAPRDGLDRARLDTALAWTEEDEHARALAVLDALPSAPEAPALLANVAALRLAAGEVDAARAALAAAAAAVAPDAVAVRAALAFNGRRARALEGAPATWLTLPLPTASPALSARLVRFADTGGMITAEVVFANLSDGPVEFCPDLAASRLVDEAAGTVLTARLSLGFACPVNMAPAGEWVAWVKFDRPRTDGPFTLDFAGVNRTVPRLELP
jgi:hypothetical protein